LGLSRQAASFGLPTSWLDPAVRPAMTLDVTSERGFALLDMHVRINVVQL
jgi:hypothetical protein